jgi:L-lactate dehydrogenase complex protein LldE
MPHAKPHVALFITCLTDQFYPHVGVAVTKILEHYGCRVSFPQAQTCCGQPFYNNGFHDEAKDLARKMVEVFEPYEYVVTPSGSCCAMVLVHNTYEFVEFLDKVLKVDLSSLKLPAPETVTYHYTCHLRGIGVKDEGLRLLRQIGNVDFKPM